ncbi:hypothetical protein M758_5G109900 [Ceratodon purpureus]|nr:hypothetical protein M758_5G109900 [Ceratodon purpureus]
MPFDKGIKNKKIFDYRQSGQKIPMDQEFSERRVEASICLSSARNINVIKDSLQQNLPDFECKERGNIITVSGYPPNNEFNERNILAIVQKHDRGAYLQRPNH